MMSSLVGRNVEGGGARVGPALRDAGGELREELAPSRVLPLICVRPPYFALADLCSRGSLVCGTVAPEHPLGSEVGPIAAAEAGRHLAILGSCAVALANPVQSRHFYLAKEARIERTATRSPIADTRLEASAKATFRDRRSARASGTLGVGGASLFELEVTYAVLSEPLFHRLHASSAYRPLPTGADRTEWLAPSPYQRPLRLEIVESAANRLSAILPAMGAEACAGHFSALPCVPVAVLMHALSHAAMALLDARAGAPLRYRIQSSEVWARELVLAGTRLTIEANYLGQSSLGERVGARAMTGSGVVGEFITVFQAC